MKTVKVDNGLEDLITMIHAVSLSPFVSIGIAVLLACWIAERFYTKL